MRGDARDRGVVVGSLNQDVIVETDRRPAGGETVLGRSLATAQGGKGANQAAAAARAGARVAMVGCVGDDAAGAALLRGLERAGVDTGAVRVLDGETSGTAVIVVDGAGENSIVVVAGANGRLAAADVERALAARRARGRARAARGARGGGRGRRARRRAARAQRQPGARAARRRCWRPPTR